MAVCDTRANAMVLPLVLLLLGACGSGREPVDWTDPAPVAGQLASSKDLIFDGNGRLVTRVAPSFLPPRFASECSASVRAARDTTGDFYAVWWSTRVDGTADVVVSRSPDGVAWQQPSKVDTADAGAVACRRPPPSIYVDGRNVHVAYAMAAREGPGIFASHSMDGGMTFHTPVPVVYGERLGVTSIAARGDVVAVAYEDPNSDPQRIGLALSRTMGHSFESRQLVSPPTGAVRAPAVALGNGVIAVTWDRALATDAQASRMLRQGTIR